MPLAIPAGLRSSLCSAAVFAAFSFAFAAEAQAGPPASPNVSVMVTGTAGQTIINPTGVAAAALSRAVGSSQCSVAAGTPLAALAALPVSFGLVDYGKCSSDPADAALLFVDDINGIANSGDMGWACKVNNRGCLAAADPNGAYGTGPMQGGEKVLWFWCISYPCQRSLEIRTSASVRTRSLLTVSLRAYDDDGNWIPAVGAKVSFGTAIAKTGSSGTVRLPAPARAGSYLVRATEMTPRLKRPAAFPVPVTVLPR